MKFLILNKKRKAMETTDIGIDIITCISDFSFASNDITSTKSWNYLPLWNTLQNDKSYNMLKNIQ